VGKTEPDLGLSRRVGEVARGGRHQPDRLGGLPGVHEIGQGLGGQRAAAGITGRGQVQRPAAEQAGHRRGHQPGLRGGPPQDRDRLGVPRLGHVHDEFRDVRWRRPVPQHHVDGLAAQALPDGPGQGRVDGLADQGVPEGHPVAVLGDQSGGQRLAQSAEDRGRTGAGEPGEFVRRETAAQHRGHLQGVSRARGQPRQLVAYRVDEPQRYPGSGKPGDAAVDRGQILLAQAAEQLGQQERLAPDVGQDLQQRRVGYPAEQILGDAGHSGPVEGAQRDRHRVGGLQVGQGRTSRRDQLTRPDREQPQDPVGGELPGQRAERGEGGRVGPLHIVHRDQHGRAERGAFQRLL